MSWCKRGLRPAARRAIWPLALAAALLGAPAGTWARGPAPVIQLQTGVRGRAIPRSFLGLALEYHAVTQYGGSGPGSPNPVLIQLIRNLNPGQLPVLRIGGDSTDWTWYPLAGHRAPSGISFALTPAWLASTRALVRALNARLILGVNLEADSAQVAGAEAGALVAGLGRRYVQALELGNEPELYGVLPWTHTNGRPVSGRPSSYSINDYLSDVARVRRRLPRVPLAMPATGNMQWMAELGLMLARVPGIRMVTFHRYPLDKCQRDPGQPDYPTVPNLLAPRSTAGLLAGVASEITLAHRARVTFRVGEMNTITCGGLNGISNTFASALWALDAMFATARAGSDGVNIETSPFPGGPNQLFTFHQVRGQWEGWVRPEYYGLYEFEQAAPPGSRFEPLVSSAGPQVHAWAVRTPARRLNVVLINAALRRSHAVVVRLPRAARAVGSVVRLTGPGVYATAGVALGGQAFAAGTTTGTLPAAPAASPLAPIGGGYDVQLPPASAAVLTLPSG